METGPVVQGKKKEKSERGVYTSVYCTLPLLPLLWALQPLLPTPPSLHYSSSASVCLYTASTWLAHCCPSEVAILAFPSVGVSNSNLMFKVT